MSSLLLVFYHRHILCLLSNKWMVFVTVYARCAYLIILSLPEVSKLILYVFLIFLKVLLPTSRYWLHLKCVWGVAYITLWSEHSITVKNRRCSPDRQLSAKCLSFARPLPPWGTHPASGPCILLPYQRTGCGWDPASWFGNWPAERNKVEREVMFVFSWLQIPLSSQGCVMEGSHTKKKNSGGREFIDWRHSLCILHHHWWWLLGGGSSPIQMAWPLLWLWSGSAESRHSPAS